MKLFYVIAALLTLGPAPVSAGTFSPPKGCSAFLTVQMKSCQVTHHWTCADAPRGEHWIMSIDADGPAYHQHLDRDFRWLESVGMRSGYRRQLITPEVDANSLTELLQNQRDDFDFEQKVIRSGRVIGREHIWGYDRLNGTTVTIDGETLLETEFMIEVRSNSVMLVRTTGKQYVSERFRLFFQGRETEISERGTYHYDDTPVLFIEPGEPGFLADEPEYGCNQMMSSLSGGARNIYKTLP